MIKKLVMLLVCVAMAAPALADNWNGDGDGVSWNDGDNWVLNVVPTAANTYIDNTDPAGTYAVEVNANVPVHGDYTNIRNGATLTINADLTSGDDFRIDYGSTVTMNAGTLTCDEKMKYGNVGGVGTFYMKGGTVTMTDDLEIYAGSVLEYSGGSFTCPVELELKSGTIKVVGYDAAGLLSINGMKDGSGGTFEFVPNAAGQVTAITNTDAAEFESQNLVVDLANLTGAAEIMLFDANVTMGAFSSIAITQGDITLTEGTAGALAVNEYFLDYTGGSGTDVVLSVNVVGGFDFVPTPADGDPVPFGSLPLSWLNLPDPCNVADDVLVNVFWDTDAAGGDIEGTTTQILTEGINALTTVAVTPALDNTTYYWKIVAIDPNTTGGTPYDLAEAVYSFTTVSDNLAPVVNAGYGVAGDDLVTFLTDGFVDVPMDASVVDEDDTVNSWTVTKVPDTIADPTFSEPVDALDVTVTFTEAGTYTLTLTASDGAAAPVDDSLVVTVYADGCEAAKIELPYSETEAREMGDTNYDCEVNLVDFAAMASNWLDDASL